MSEKMLETISTIYIAYGATDFRLRGSSLCRKIEKEFQLNPYKGEAFLFCNKKRTSIRVLYYDRNGFVVAEKMLVGGEKIKFQWLKNKGEVKRITKQQLNWLMKGLKIEQKRSFGEINLDEKRVAI